MAIRDKQLKSEHGDEYYTYAEDVKKILPYVRKFNKIWCPFDTEESNFVKELRADEHIVMNTHISNGEDFYGYLEVPDGVECIVSNPPFSSRDAWLTKLYEFGLPFAMIMNFNGIFDNRLRYDLFANNEFSLLIPKGRMKFARTDAESINSPNFQSIWICHKLTEERIVFLDK